MAMALGETAAPTRRRSLLLWLRMLVSAVLLAVLVTKIHPENLLPEHQHLSTVVFLIAGLLLTGIGVVLSAWRWQRVLRVFDADVSLRTLSSHYFAGQFVGNVLPSTIGGDVLRVSRGASATGSGSVAFASVALERLSGFVALPLLVVLGFVARPSLLESDNAWVALAIAGGTLALLAVILSFAASPRLAGRFKDHDNWMRFIGAVHVGVDRLRSRSRETWGILLAALVYQGSVVASVFCAAHVLDLALPTAAVLAFVPAVAMAQTVPLSVSGFGVREGLLVLFLTPLGVSTGGAVALGLLWYAMLLVVSLLGAPAFAVGHRHHARPTRGDDSTR